MILMNEVVADLYSRIWRVERPRASYCSSRNLFSTNMYIHGTRKLCIMPLHSTEHAVVVHKKPKV